MIDAEGSTTSEKLYAVRATCLIGINDVCTVYFPDSDDLGSAVFHGNCHEQNAKVVKLNGKNMDIEMTSGPWKGRVVPGFHPLHLFFWGPFGAAGSDLWERKEYKTLIRTPIPISSFCVIDAEHPDNPLTHEFCRCCHDHQAVVLARHEESIEIEMQDGLWEGRILNVGSMFLSFPGPFVPK